MNLVRNYIYNLLYQFLILFIPLISTPYISRVLGPDGIGDYSYTFSVVTFFVLFGSLGVNIYGQREIAFNQKNIKKRSIIFWELFFSKAFTLLIALLIYFFIFLIMPSRYYFLLIIEAIEILAAVIDISWYFQGLENFKITIGRNSLVKLSSLLLMFLIVKNNSHVWLYALIISGANFLGNLTLWLYLPNYVEKVSFKTIRLFHNYKTVFALFIPQIAIQIYTVLDKTMIGAITGIPEENGYYEQSQKVIKICIMIITALGTVIIPRIAAFFSEGKMDSVKNYIYKSYQITGLLGFPVMFGTVAIVDYIIPWYMGAGYEKSVMLVKIFSLLIIAIGLSSVTGSQYLLPTKREKIYTISVIVGACVNTFFNVLLIPIYLSAGAAFASVIAEFSVSAVQISYTVKNREISLFKICNSSKKYFFASIIMYSLLCGLKGICSATVGCSIFLILMGIIIYVICLLIMRDTLLFACINKLFEIILAKNCKWRK